MVGGACQVTDPSMRWGQALVMDESREGALSLLRLDTHKRGQQQQVHGGSSSSSRSSKDTQSDGAACVPVMRACSDGSKRLRVYVLTFVMEHGTWMTAKFDV